MHITDYEKVQQLVWNNVFILDGGDALGTKTIFARDLANALLKLSDSDAAVNAIKIMETEPATKLDKTARLLVGTSDGNKTVDLSEGFFTLLDAALPVEMKRNFYRGKNLGGTITNEQWENIKNRTYKGFFIGDYWRINNVSWRIADFFYWGGNGDDKLNETIPHLVIFPDEHLGQSQMYETNSTSKGFINSKVYMEAIPKILTEIITPIFGNSHLLTYRNCLSNMADQNGIVTGETWTNIILNIPNEPMVFGTRNHSNITTSGNSNVSRHVNIDHEQLSLLRLNPDFISFPGYSYWLRDISTSAYFTMVSRVGCPDYNSASLNGHIRPVFGITG